MQIAFKDFRFSVEVKERNMTATVASVNDWVREVGAAVINVETLMSSANHVEVGVRVWYRASAAA